MTRTRATALVVAVSAFLLVSMGGAIVAAPLTLPLMYLGVRRGPTRSFTIVGGLVSALTTAEVVWAAAYVTIGESEPWIWLLPTVGAVAMFAVFQRLRTAPHEGAAALPDAR